MSLIEWIAAALGLLCVALAVRRSMWSYAFGIASTALLAFVVFEARLYSQALLQLFFVTINAYGFVNWRRAKALSGAVIVERMTPRAMLGWLVWGALAIALWGWAMDRLTDAAQPLADAAISVTSIVAQLLMARRKLENWLLWIAVDLASIPLFLAQDLPIVGALYAVYLGLAIWGYIDWRRAGAASEPVVA